MVDTQTSLEELGRMMEDPEYAGTIGGLMWIACCALVVLWYKYKKDD